MASVESNRATSSADSSDQNPEGETARIARASSVISLGNVISRVLGLAREIVKSNFFGAGGLVDAFNVATIVPTMISDLLIGGMVNSALVPVFSEYAQEKREELWSLVSALLSLTVVVLSVFIVIGEIFAPQIAFLLSSGSSPEVLALTTRLLRITIPAVLFINLSAVLSGLLYALKRFSLPAFTAAIFNASIVILTLLFHNRFGITAMAFGLLFGSVAQVWLQLPGLRDSTLRLRLAFKHPGLRRIVLLYMPIALGLIVDVLISRPISYTLASQTGEGGISWMNFATYLTQLPQGLVATAISFAVLPTLSAHAAARRANGNGDAFKATLAKGLKLVIVLIVPAAVGLFILAQPVVALLYERGAFLATDTAMTALALRLYLLGLPFAAVDLVLVFAFYALQDTLTPSLVGVGTIIIYLITAVTLLPHLGLFSLMIADSVKHLLHMSISAVLLQRKVGSLSQHNMLRTLGLTIIAAALMGAATYGSFAVTNSTIASDGLLQRVILVGVPGLIGATLYLLFVTLFRLEEITLLWSALRRRLTG